MKSPRRIRRGPPFQLLTKEAQESLQTYEHAVICLMVLLAATSILWSVSTHILSGDFQNGIIGAKLVFRPRDFSALDERAKEIFYRDLGNLINETYTEAAFVAADRRGNEISKQPLVAEERMDGESQTEKPKVRKIAHLFRTSARANEPEAEPDPEPQDDSATTATTLPTVKFDPVLDRKFLATMTIDVHLTRWRQSSAVQFIYSFPFLSEIISIIWAAMCLIFQSGVKKYWGLPKPWRIVVPSMVMFSLMTVSTAVYTVLANRYLREFCTDLRAHLSDPNALSCGEAISVLRPAIRQHEFSHDVYLNLFRISYTLSLVLWLLALLIMALRFVFAIDFQLVDVQSSFDPKLKLKLKGHGGGRKHAANPEFTEVLLNSPHDQTRFLHVGEGHKSEDDFQSAKSQLSEVASPLLDGGDEAMQRQQQQRVL